VQKKGGADVDFQAGWAHVSNQPHQVSPRGVSDWWRESVRKSVSVHQDKIRGSAILVAVARGVGQGKATLPARRQLSQALQVLRALLVQPLLAALPRNPLRDAFLFGGNQDARRGRPRTGTPRRARGMLAFDRQRVAANKAQAAHRPPLHSAAKVRAVTRHGPPTPPARLWRGPTRPGAGAGVRAHGNVAAHGMGALALRTDAPQAPPQLGLGNCPRRRAMLGAGGEGGGVISRPRRRLLLAGSNVSCWLHLRRGGQLRCKGRRAHNGHSVSAALVSARGRCRGSWRYTTCRGWGRRTRRRSRHCRSYARGSGWRRPTKRRRRRSHWTRARLGSGKSRCWVDSPANGDGAATNPAQLQE